MKIIRYIQSKNKFASNYETLLNARITTLKNYYEKQLNSYYTANQMLLKINDMPIIAITQDEIAKAVNKRLDQPEIYEDLTNIYSSIGETTKVLNANLKEMKNQPGSIIYDIQNGLIDSGKYSVKLINMKQQLKDIPNFLQQNAGNKNIYGPIGELGERTSSLAATAIGDFLIQKIENNIGKVKGITIKRQNLGTQHTKDYHYQTDNGFSYNIQLESGDNIKAQINFSDKASKKQLQHFDRKKTTGQVYLARSNPAELAKALREVETSDLNPGVYYNLISYHKYGQNKWSHLYQGNRAGEALKNYYGYKLMLRTFITSQAFEHIDFTVMGNKIIPETEVLKQLRDLKDNGINKYQAVIENYKLIQGGKGNTASKAKSAVKNEEEAQEVIDKMLVAIKTSFRF